MAEIELSGVTKRFDDVTAVENVSLLVPDGELLVLVGPSGCGKTTLLRTIAGLDGPTEGEVYLGGTRITDLPARKRDVSLVFQDFALFPHLSARENLSFDLRMEGADDVDRRVEETAELLKIADLLDRAIEQLSGGQKQRVALGRAIATEPSAFLLDEPLANLDANLREHMRTEIVRLQDRFGVTTVHVTHDQEEALTMGDHVAVMREGSIEQFGTPESVYRKPASLFVARFVGTPTMNLLPARFDDGAVELATGDGRASVSVPVSDGRSRGDAVIGVRPEHVGLSTDRPSDDSWFKARVRFDEFHGADRFVYLEAPGLSEFVARQPAETTYADGRDVWTSVSPEAVHVFDAVSGERLERKPAADDIRTPDGEPR